MSNRYLNIYNLLSKSWEKLIITTPKLNTMLTPKIVFKKCNTINDILVSTKFPPPRWSQLTIKPCIKTIPTSKIQQSLGTNYFSKPCRKPRCITCNIINTHSKFNSSVFDKIFDLTEDLDCSSENIIYLVTCSKCNL